MTNSSLPKTSTTIPVGPAAIHAPKTEIVVEKDGDSIKALQITCKCGEVIVIDCKYSDVE